jgi:hypothetical protein
LPCLLTRIVIPSFLRSHSSVWEMQIPSDFVVKMERLDIPDVILSMIWRRPLVYAGGRHRKSAL